MNNATLYSIARATAVAAHAGQHRRGGEPYYTHLLAVALKVPYGLEPLAWLHDVLEDTDVTVGTLRIIGIPDVVIDAVQLLTRREGEPYDEYIDHVIASDNAAVLTVKIADMEHNLGDSPAQFQRERYQRNLPRLHAALAQIKAIQAMYERYHPSQNNGRSPGARVFRRRRNHPKHSRG